MAERSLWELAADRLRAAGVESPALEAQILAGLALGLNRTQVLIAGNLQPNPAQNQELERLLREREQGVPLAYLRGSQEFYGLDFEVSPAVLIPRPETELLVEVAIKRLEPCGGTLVDVGCGSGCIVVSIAHSLPRVTCVGVDVSADALAVARRNAKLHAVDSRIQFVRGDMLDSMETASADVVASNPPYIASAEIASLQREVRDHEPRAALDGGEDGFVFHRRLLEGARRVLKPGGLLAVEVASGQAPELVATMGGAGFVGAAAHRDLAGIERVVAGIQAESHRDAQR